MKKNTILGVVGAAAMLACLSAYATPTDQVRYSIDGGVTWTTIADNSGSDTQPADEAINVNIAGSSFVIHISSSAFESGTLSKPAMDLGVSGSTTGTGTLNLIVEYTDVGFTPRPTGSFLTTFFQNGTVSATEWTVIGNGSTPFSGADINPVTHAPTGPAVVGPIGPLVSGGVTSGSSSAGALGETDPYVITLVERYTGSGTISSDASLTVPDGGNTLMLLGSALSVLGLGVFRKSRKA